MRTIKSTFVGALGLASALATVGVASAAPPKEKRRHQQVMPTGAEDAPAAARTAAAAKQGGGDALIDEITRKDTVGLAPVVHSDGSMTVNLEERFQHVSRVVERDDGTTQVVCDDKPLPPRAAASKTKAKANAKTAKSAKAVTSAPAPVAKSPGLEEM